MQHPIIHLSSCPPRPWKNGLGSTREIAVQPSAAGSGDFLWRVSIAEVDNAAPFSTFSGIDRHIVLLDGDGFTMMLDDGRTHALTTPLVPFAFPGEAGVTVALAGGPTRDFNLMVRRAQARGEVRVWRGPSAQMLDSATIMVHCVRGMLDTPAGCLHAGDTWQPSSANDSVTLHDNAVALQVRVETRHR